MYNYVIYLLSPLFISYTLIYKSLQKEKRSITSFSELILKVAKEDMSIPEIMKNIFPIVLEAQKNPEKILSEVTSVTNLLVKKLTS